MEGRRSTAAVYLLLIRLRGAAAYCTCYWLDGKVLYSCLLYLLLIRWETTAVSSTTVLMNIWGSTVPSCCPVMKRREVQQPPVLYLLCSCIYYLLSERYSTAVSYACYVFIIAVYGLGDKPTQRPCYVKCVWY